MSKNTTIGLVVVVLVILLGWYYFQSQKGSYTQPPTPKTTMTEPEATPATPSGQMEVTEKNMVTISSGGFSPQNITIKVGESVVWVNEDTQNHQVNSAVHPTHQVYPPLNSVGLVKSEEKKSLTFPEAGTYKYHDHLNPSLTGSVTVE